MRMTLLGDAALLVEYDPIIDVTVNARVLAVSERVRQAHVPGVRDVVPAYASFAVHFDPRQADIASLRDVVARADAARILRTEAHPAPVEIPVCYGGRFGPDLAAVATWAGCAPVEVVAAHSSRDYRVFLVGFLPGFPYMASVDERIAMPRRDTPRNRVAAGSVGIAGRQTGIYSLDSPGGWQIIGRTPLVLFDPHRDRPALLAPGQHVRFLPVPSSTFESTRAAAVRR